MRTLQGSLGSDQLAEYVAGKFMLILVPGELLAGKAKPVLGQDTHTSVELPYLLLVIVVSCVTLYVAVDVELFVKLLQKDALVESPFGGIAIGIYLPPFRHDAVLDDTRVANERVDPIGSHHGHGVAFTDGGCSMLYLFLASCKKQYGHESEKRVSQSIHYYICKNIIASSIF